MAHAELNYLPKGCFDQLEVIDSVLFTSREIDVIACITNMRGSSKIASILNISPRTVETHILNVKRKIEHSAREGIIDFIEKSGKIGIVRKHYQYLLTKTEFNKRLKSIFMLIRNKNFCCGFIRIAEVGNVPITQQMQSHLTEAGVKLISYTKIEEAISNYQKGNHFIYVVDKIERVPVKILTQAGQSPENFTFLVLDGPASDDLSELLACIVNITEQENYYYAILEILKRVLSGVNIDNIIVEFKKCYQLITFEPREQLITSKAESVVTPQSTVEGFFSDRKLLVMTIGALIIGGMLGYSLINKHLQAAGTMTVKTASDIPKLQLASYISEILSGHEKFIGREEELKQIEQGFAKNNIIIIAGRSGIGKSSLVIEYGKRQKQDKIIRYFNADAATKIDQKYRELAEEMGINVERQQKDMVMKLVNNKLGSCSNDILFIFDNVDQYEDVKDYLNNLPSNVKALITTRQPNLITEKTHITLREFNNQEADQYLQKALQKRYIGKNDAQELIENIGTLPYDLKCVVAYLLDSPSVDVKTVNQEIGSKIKDKLFEQLAASRDEETEQAWKVLQYAAYLDPDFISVEILNELFPQNQKLLSNAINRLESLSLVSTIADKDGRAGFMIHRELQQAIQRSAKYHPKYAIDEKEVNNNLLIILDKLFVEVSFDSDIKWQIAGRLMPHVKKITENRIKVIPNEAKIKRTSLYYKQAAYYLQVNVDYRQALKYAEMALHKRQSIYSGNHPDILKSLRFVGRVYRALGEGQKGLEYSNSALKMSQELYKGNHPEVASSLREVGTVLSHLGETKYSLINLKAALKMYQELYKGNHLEIVEVLNALGITYMHSGQFNKGLEYFNLSLSMFKELSSNNHFWTAALLNNIAHSYNKLGNYQEALKCAEECLNMYKALYSLDHPYTVYALRSFGAALIETSRVEEALSVLHQALEINEKFDINRHYITGFILYELGRGYLKKGDYQKALEYGEKALNLRQSLYSTVKQHLEIAESLSSVADIYKALKNNDKALELYKETLAMRIALSLEKSPETEKETQRIKEKIAELGEPPILAFSF